MKCNYLAKLAVLMGMSAVTVPAAAQSISLNFSENSANQVFTQSVPIGPLGTNSANWNNTADVGSPAAGSMSNLKDETGATTAVSVTWNSTNTWFNSDGTADDEHRMSVGYLDDGDGPDNDGIGASVTFSNIPYTTYRVYGLLGSDQGNLYNTVDFTVNGVEVFGAATTAPAYGNINTSLAQAGSFWSLANGTTRGNYWTLDSTGSTLTISGFERASANRGSLGAVIIRDLSTPVFDLTLKAIVNRTTGQVTITNNTGASVSIAGLGLQSTDGAWTPANWTSITSNYDQGGSVSADPWLEFSRSAADLSEGTLGTGALAQGQSVNMGAIWSKYYKEGTDLRFEYLDATSGQTIVGLLEFTGNGGNPFAIGDFNGDGALNSLDWPTVRNNFNSSHVGLLPAQAYKLGDMNGDLLTNANDLFQFKAAFDAVNGAGAFAAMAGAVPEPGAFALMAVGAVALLRRRRVSKVAAKAAPLAAVIMLLGVASTASAQSGIGVNFRGGQGDDADPATSGANVTGPAGVVFSQGNWNNVGGNNPATDWDATVTGLLNSAGANSGASITWSTDETWASTAGGQAGVADQDRNLMDGYIDAIASQPTITATLNNIPYSAYDVYVYVGSDGDNRTGRVQINNSLTSDRWFRTSTSGAAFTSAANYIEATAKTEAASVPSNYVVYQDVIGSTLNIGVTRGSNNVGLHGVQIVQETNPQVLRLEVNTTSGLTQIRNLTAASISLDFFEITSASAALDVAGWTPLGTGTNDGSNWEVLGNLGDSILAQFFLNGQGTIGAGQALSLGAAYDGPAQDLAFRYNDINSFTRSGLVSYVSGGQPGDFDADGNVDGNDFLVWQRGGAPGGLTAANLATWRTNFGAGGATAAAAAIPEPASLALLTSAMGGLALCTRRRQAGAPKMTRRTGVRIVVPSMSAVIAVCVAASAMAAVTNDRDYRLGEGGPGENGSPGAIVGSGHNITGALDTLDEVGPTGAFIDLAQSGNPVYLNVASGPKARPGVPAGSLGVQFDGVDDVLFGTPLNRPDELATLVGGSYPFNYTGLTTRGLQGWVYPDQAGLSAGAFQSIVFDTISAGGPAITADGKWTQINSEHVDGGGAIPATVPVVGDAWHHVMHHQYPLTGPGSPRNVSGSSLPVTAVVYVNGIAVSVNNDSLGSRTAGSRVGVLAVGAAEIPGDGSNPTYGNFFRGAVDNLEMYVYGNNTSQGGQNYGAFDLFADNDWIANRIATTVPGGVLKPGDVNRDGAVNGTGTGPAASDDVSAFIAGWRDRKTFQGAHGVFTAGDWETWGWGDMDHDGVVGFADWYILRANHPSPASLNLEALLGAVPEPSSAALGGLALLGAGLVRKRSRTTG
jgi:hypothetical protein